MSFLCFFKKKDKSGLTYNRFETWLDAVMNTPIPNDVVAFCFNLYEDANRSWTLELVGASSYDKTDNDWACDEVFSIRDNPLTWYDEKEWQDVLTETKKILKDYLEKGLYGKALKERQGLAVGFVDGDLTLL